MRNICTILFALTALSGLLAAQAACLSPVVHKHTLPAGFESADGNYSNVIYNYPLNTTSSTRWQYCYSWTQFVHQVPIAICEISFRHASDTSFTGGTYQGVDITLASSTFPHTQQSATFGNNLDVDATTVVTAGSVTIPTYTAPGVPAASAPFNVNIPFVIQPFFYNPALQKDLVIDITVNGPTTTVSYIMDGSFPDPNGSHNGNTANPAALASDFQHPDACAIVEITYSLGHGGLSNQFDLVANTSGGGTGDLTLAFANIPAGTVEGFTFISTVPYTAVVPSSEAGLGPWFGIFPDPFTFQSLFSPVALGNPFHWAYPAAPFFPDSAIVLPAGTLSSLAGQTWELVGVALGPGITLLGSTAPVPLAW